MFRLSTVLTLGITAALSATTAWADINTANAAYNRGDYNAAVKEYRQMALSGDPVAQFNLGQAYKLGRGVPLDLNLALDWYRKAAQHTPPLAEAQDAYGLLLFQSGKRQESLPYLQQSASRGDPRAQYVLGTAYFNGDLVAKDPVKAYAYMTRASASGNLPKASEALATMDNYIPIGERQKGLAMAREMELGAQRQQLAALDPKSVGPGVSEAPPPIRTEELPPSNAPGVSYPDPGPETDAPPKPVRTPRPIPARPIQARPLPQVYHAPAATEDAPAPVRAMPKPQYAATGRYRVQLGAFGDQGKAQAYGESILARNAAFANLKFYLVKAGAVTRLQAGPLPSASAAAQVCASEKAKGGACLVVNP
jgi:TPR repeat protein